MEFIKLDMNEAVELTFGVKIEGTTKGKVSARLCCESSDGIIHAFPGKFSGEGDGVTFKVHQTNKLMSEGIHPAWIEVIVDNRQFVPAEFQIDFVKPVNVQVESLQRSAPVKAATTVTTSTTPKISKTATGSEAKDQPKKTTATSSTTTKVNDELEELEELSETFSDIMADDLVVEAKKSTTVKQATAKVVVQQPVKHKSLRDVLDMKD